MNDVAFFTIALIPVVASVIRSCRLFLRTRRNQHVKMRRRVGERQTRGQVRAFLGRQLLAVCVIAVLILSLTPNGGGLHDLGFQAACNVPLAFIAGLAVYCLYAELLFAIPAKRKSNELGRLEAWFATVRCFIPRDRRTRWLNMVTVGFLNPVTEEILFRGVFVYYLAARTGSLWIALPVGLCLCLATHLYQGLRTLPHHAAFFLLSTAILYSPLGLIGAIGCHFGGDVMPFLKLRSAMRSLGLLRRERQLLALVAKEAS